ncbi:hypothetical protein C8F01DRAFT_1156410 [Mycena amicta]|nr:hypothetical protein C8F01DRAFT_1156410 [Mycena amicta]
MVRQKTTQLEALVRVVDGSPEGWTRIVGILCNHFGLPSDMSTRSSLKKIHAKIENVYPRMEKEYERTADERIKGGIVDIYAKMCADSILRNRLFQYGFLGQLISLMAIPSCRNLALNSLVTITRHGGLEVRMKIAKITCLPLLQVVKDFPEDDDTAELALRTLSHCIVAVVSNEGKELDPKLYRALPLSAVAQAFIDALHCPDPPPTLLSHATLCLVEMTHDVKLLSMPSAVNLFVAGLRSKAWYHRSRCMAGLLTLVIPNAQQDMRLSDPMKAARCVVSIASAPMFVQDVMRKYGLERSEMHQMVASNKAFQHALGDAYAAGGDMYTAGKTIAGLILGTENAFFDGFFPGTNRAGKTFFPGGSSSPSGSFQLWSDSLPQLAKAIRAKVVDAETPLADVLDLKCLLMRQRHAEVRAFAQRTLQHNPDFAYGYYILMLSLDGEEGLRAAKKGVRCTPGPHNLTTFLRLQMLQRGSQMACNVGMQTLNEPGMDGNPPMDVGIAFLLSAMADADEFFAQAPPDHRDMRSTCAWLVLLHVMMDEKISDDLREIKPFIERLKFVDEFHTWLGIPPVNTQIRLVAETLILKNFSAAQREWGDAVGVYDKECADYMESELATPSKEKRERDLAAWVEGLELDDSHSKVVAGCGGGCFGHDHEDEDADGHSHSHSHGSVPGAGEQDPQAPLPDKTALYRCSFCQNRSAVLRKCAGCSEARYCDATCQKRDWKVHKKKCGAGKK